MLRIPITFVKLNLFTKNFLNITFRSKKLCTCGEFSHCTKNGHGVKVGPGPRDLGKLGYGTRDPPQSLKLGPGTPLKFKSGTPGPPPKFKSETPGPPSKFKNGTLIIIFLHCLTYYVPDKYMYNMEIIFHE